MNIGDDVWRMGVGLVADVDYHRAGVEAEPLIVVVNQDQLDRRRIEMSTDDGRHHGRRRAGHRGRSAAAIRPPPIPTVLFTQAELSTAVCAQARTARTRFL